ncbi:MAG: hypothetical protein LQ339_000257 [Xanthoria mediterranea]|nr:MAG: hypothetical protein LQ339_000257 [Xanthoria mediterranea]
MESMFNTLMKVLNKAKSQAGLLGIVDQHWRSNGFLSSDMIIDQTRASHCEIVTTLMGQIYGDIESIVHQVLEYTASWCQLENNVTCGKKISVPTSMPSEISHICKRFASVKSTQGWMTLSILAHSESFRNACRTFDMPLWDQLMHDIAQTHVSLELFFKVRGLDWVTPLRSVAHLIPQQELQSYLECQKKRELQNIYLESPHSYVVPKADGILQRPHYQSVLHLNISSNTYDSKAFPVDPSIRTQNDGACESCGRASCDCEPSTCDKINRPLTELIHSSADKGIGVRTLQRVKAGDVLDEYVGELKRASTVADQTYAMELEGLPAGHHSRNDHNPILIDAQVYGNWTRYINASCNPSLKFAAARIGGRHRIMVVAVRDIDTFEELTIGYGDNYWLGSDTKMCACNEETCRHATMAQKEKARWGCAIAAQNNIQRSHSTKRIVFDADTERMDTDANPPAVQTFNQHNKDQNFQRVGGKKKKRSSKPGQPSNPVHHPSPYAHVGSVSSSQNSSHRNARHGGGGNRVKGQLASALQAASGRPGPHPKRNIPACPAPIRK